MKLGEQNLMFNQPRAVYLVINFRVDYRHSSPFFFSFFLRHLKCSSASYKQVYHFVVCPIPFSRNETFLSMKTNYWHSRARKLKTDNHCMLQFNNENQSKTETNIIMLISFCQKKKKIHILLYILLSFAIFHFHVKITLSYESIAILMCLDFNKFFAERKNKNLANCFLARANPPSLLVSAPWNSTCKKGDCSKGNSTHRLA